METILNKDSDKECEYIAYVRRGTIETRSKPVTFFVERQKMAKM